MRLKPIIAGVALIVGLALIGGFVWFWKHRADAAAANQPHWEQTEFVDIITAEKIPWQPKAKLVGTVVPKRWIDIANEIAGVVTEVGFDSGDTVQPGQVLLKFDTSTETADLAAAEAAHRLSIAAIAAAEADVRFAQSDLDLAGANLTRYKTAAAGSSVAEMEFDRAQADADKATATLERQRAILARSKAESEQAAARVDQIKSTIAKKTLRAPFLARAGMRSVQVGQYLAEGTTIVGLNELADDIYLDFAIPQEYTSRASQGLVVMATSPMLSPDPVPLKVEFIDSTVNPTTRNMRVRSSVANPGHRLKPGMFIDVEVPIGPPEDRVSIPVTAVRRAAFGDHVFVIGPGDPAKDAPGSERVHQRIVTLGPTIGDRVLIETGLQAGERIAGAGSFKLREGALVKQAPPPDQKPAQPAAPVASGG